jgi:hypothetical protein
MNGYIPETITTTGTVRANARLGHRAGNPQRRPVALANAQAESATETTATGKMPPTTATG